MKKQRCEKRTNRFLISGHRRWKTVLVLLGCVLSGVCMLPGPGGASETNNPPLTLRQTVQLAMEANLNLKAAKDEMEAAESSRRVARSFFLPTANLTYQYQRNDDKFAIPGLGVITPQDRYALAASVTQPLFTGFSIRNRYEASKMRLEAAKVGEGLTRQDVVLAAKEVYFTLLRAQKLLEVAQEAVALSENQEAVAQQFYNVGMTPLNDLLKAQVELANARQELLGARNGVDVAKANLNTLLRRPVTGPVAVTDIRDYAPLTSGLNECLETAEEKRLELQQAELEVELAETDVALAKKDLYPSVNLSWSYYQEGTDWDAAGGAGIYSDASGWNVKAVASWDLWQWGRTHYGIQERLSRLQQARHRKAALLDRIHLEVTEAYLKTVESEKAIVTAEKAIEQAKENFRITQERYKAQMAISLEVFDARTLLSRAMTNYYRALYAFKIAKASLDRAMGRESQE